MRLKRFIEIRTEFIVNPPLTLREYFFGDKVFSTPEDLFSHIQKAIKFWSSELVKANDQVADELSVPTNISTDIQQLKDMFHKDCTSYFRS